MLSPENLNEDEKVKTPLYFYAKNVQKKAAESQPSFGKDPDVQEFCDLRCGFLLLSRNTFFTVTLL